ncbi:flavin reductase family protein [Spirillospora sp. CA-294931]|uniref:flavin reductase family protein n=1 Tax=Spirillospora sp. CA-294931 TaxID=3240042 RepID=UPI003D8A0639
MVSADAFRDVMRHWASGVAVITMRSPDGPHGMTVNALLSVSLDPPTLLVVLARNGRTHGILEQAGRFTVNILSAGQRPLADRFTKRRRPGEEEFDGLDWHPSPGGAPVLAGGLAALDCLMTEQTLVADHALVIATVTHTHLPSAEGGPLVYAGRRYHALPQW